MNDRAKEYKNPEMPSIDWARLERLRDRFLSGAPQSDDYWQSDLDLELYDRFFGARIGWKWRAVTAELEHVGFVKRVIERNPAPVVFDFGCGTGVASRAIAAVLPGAVFRLYDRSDRAMRFTERSLHRIVGKDRVRREQKIDGGAFDAEPIDLFVVSHVLGELDDSTLERLTATAERARAIVWVEPGSHDVSRRLGALRERWRSAFSIAAPCPHREACGVFAAGAENHWCHSFAPTPIGAHQDRLWAEFSRHLGIDLRALPYSFFAMERAPASAPAATSHESVRIIGRAEFSRPGARFFMCTKDGIKNGEARTRENADFVKRLEKRREPLPAFPVRLDGSRIMEILDDPTVSRE